MHRFGRSGQLKKDRWGGSFILIAGLALGAAYLAGNYLNEYLVGDKPAATESPGKNDIGLGTGSGFMPVAVEPQAFNLYAVQVGAFRSPTGASDTALKLNTKGEVGFANINTNGMSYAYAGGLFTDKQAATEYLEGLKEAKVVDAGFVATLKVPYGPDAIAAMAGTEKSKVSQGYDDLNSYLHEVALWIEARVEGKDDGVTDLVSLGKSLGTLAKDLESANLTDEKLKAFINVAKAAGMHADSLKAAANTQDTSQEYMNALNGYVSLLAQYNGLQSNTTAAN